MARLLVLLLLIAVAAVLVNVLVRDHRGRRKASVIDQLRWAFLHGAPLATRSTAAALVEFVHPSGLRFRVPTSWTVDLGGDRAGPGDGTSRGRRLRVDVQRLEGVAGDLARTLESLSPEGERTIELLANGYVMSKTFQVGDADPGAVVSYTWRLGRAIDGAKEVALFRVEVPVAVAPDVITQSDLALLDRQVRAATFAGDQSAS